MIEEDGPAAGPLVEALVAEAEAIFRAGVEDGSFRPTDDPRAVLTLIISQGNLTTPPTLARALAAAGFGPEAPRRMTEPAPEILTRGAHVDESVTRRATDAWIAAQSRNPDSGKD